MGLFGSVSGKDIDAFAKTLAQDLAKEQKRLRLPPEAMLRQLDLDLRKSNRSEEHTSELQSR